MSRRLTQYIIRPQPSCAFETGRLAECQYKIGQSFSFWILRVVFENQKKISVDI